MIVFYVLYIYQEEGKMDDDGRNLQLTLSGTRLLTAGGTSLDAMHM